MITTRHQFAYDKIIERLHSGQLRVGDRLIETVLCEQLGLSRVPLREAIRQLTSEGLVDHVAGLGATIKCPNREEIQDLYELRELLESHAAARAAERAEPRELAELQQTCDRMGAVLRGSIDRSNWDQADRDAIFDADQTFHRQVAKMGGNSRVVSLVESFQTLWKMVVYDPRLSVNGTLRTRSWAWGQHVRILRAIRRKDGDSARQLMGVHLRASREIALQAQRSLEKFL